MDLDKLARKAIDVYTERGGPDAAREDAAEVQEICEGDGSLAEKAKRAARALEEPGASAQSGPSEPGQAS